MGRNSQGKNIYLQLHPHFHLTAAAPAAVAAAAAVVAAGCLSSALPDSPSEQVQIRGQISGIHSFLIFHRNALDVEIYVSRFLKTWPFQDEKNSFEVFLIINCLFIFPCKGLETFAGLLISSSPGKTNRKVFDVLQTHHSF